MEILGLKSWYQVNMFICLYFGYVMYIFNRRSFSFVIPTIMEKDNVDNNTIGRVLTSFAAAYSIGKFFSGVLVDKLSPKIMFASGLFVAGTSNLLFSVSSPAWFSFLWFLNGLGQGPGWPATAKILRSWYPSDIFGTLWSTLSTSMNVAASFGPLICSAHVAQNGGEWRSVMTICGTVSCGYSLLTLLINKDKPEDVGLTLEHLTSNGINSSKIKSQSKQKSRTVEENNIKHNLDNKKNVWQRILLSPYAYVISSGFFSSLFLKSIVSNWSALYLIEKKAATQYLASVYLAYVEVGGVCGSIFTGYVSDKMAAKMASKDRGSPRHVIFSAWFFGLFAVFFLLRTSVHDVTSQQPYALGLGFLVGFFAYGNISLCGVLTIERSASDISGTAHACCSLAGNVGMMVAGLPFSMLMGALGWDGAFRFAEFASFVAGVVFVLAQTMKCRIGDLKKEE